jgi:hypothetical protein
MLAQPVAEYAPLSMAGAQSSATQNESSGVRPWFRRGVIPDCIESSAIGPIISQLYGQRVLLLTDYTPLFTSRMQPFSSLEPAKVVADRPYVLHAT